jgi:hypothetical protein
MQQIRVDGKDVRDFLDGTSGGINEEFETGLQQALDAARKSGNPQTITLIIEPESDDEEA